MNSTNTALPINITSVNANDYLHDSILSVD